MFVSRTSSEKAKRVAHENADYFKVPYAYGTDTSGNWHVERASTAPKDWTRVFPGGLETRGGYGSRYQRNRAIGEPTNLIAVEEGGSYAPGAYIIARVFGTPGHYDWDERDKENTILVQTDWDFPGLARSFGWRGTTDNIEAARRYLDRVAGSKVVEDPGYFSSENPRHYGDLLKGNPRRRFGSLQEKIEAGYSPWEPSPVAIASTNDGSEYMVIAVHSDIGWDFPTLRHMFPASFKMDRVRTFSNEQARIKHTEEGGPRLFKLRVDTPSRWTAPLPLNTAISYQEFDRAAGFNITGGIHGRSRL